MNRFRWVFLASFTIAVVLFFQNCAESTFNTSGQKQNSSRSDSPPPEPPLSLQILIQPQNQTVFTNQLAEFSVFVNSTDGVTFQWFHGSQILTGQNASVLQISQPKSQDAGSYYAVISRDGQAQLTSQPALLTVNSPVVGNLSLAVGTGPETTNAGSIVLAVCPAGEVKVSNFNVQNIPNADQDEGAPGWVNFALCEKNNLLNGSVALGLEVCPTGFTSAAMTTYRNVSDQDLDNGLAPNNVLMHVCHKDGELGSNVALTVAAACPGGYALLNEVTFQNTGDVENGNSAPLFVTVKLCGK